MIETLRLRAPTGVVTPELRAFLKESKSHVIACLRNEYNIRMWTLQRHEELHEMGLTLPTDFERDLEDKIIGYCDGLVPFEHVQEMWTHFIESNAGRMTEMTEQDL